MATCIKFLAAVTRAELITLETLMKGVGLLRFVIEVLPWLTPFMQPLHSWITGLNNSKMNRPAGKPGEMHKAIAQYIVWELELIQAGEEQGSHMVYPIRARGTGGSDAKATSTWARIGGWWAQTPNMPQGQVHWYSIQITEDRFPWAFKDGNPQRRIAALEMLGTVFLIRLAAWHRTHRNIDVTVRGITDSECNRYAMLKSYSSKMPGAAVHMELM